MNKATLENNLRNKVLDFLRNSCKGEYETDALTTSASEFAIPLLDDEGNEKYVLIHVSIPRGKRVGGTYEPYDGYAVAEEYAAEMAEKQAKRDASAAKKEAAEKLREQKRAIRQAKKVLEKDAE